MLELAFEVGLNQLELMDLGDYYFLLAHLFRDPRYRRHILEEERLDPQREVILDNSAFELGESIDPGELVSLAFDLPRLDVLVVPDKLGDSARTIRMCKDFVTDEIVRYLLEQRSPWLMVVAQSTKEDDVEELVSCVLIQEQVIKTQIGRAKVVYGIPRRYPTGIRLECAWRLSKLRRSSWIHFLGCPSFEDYEKLVKGLRNMKSCRFTLDTSLPWRSALGSGKHDFEAEIEPNAFAREVEGLRSLEYPIEEGL